MSFQFIATVIAMIVILLLLAFLYRRKKIKDSLIELKCTFCLSDRTDELLDTYYKQTGVHVDGLLGNDFMVANDYVIDYKNLEVRHNTVKISIKDTMDIVELPLIVLYQEWRKYIFIIDTGATTSLIHSKHTKDNLKYEEVDDGVSEIYGYGGKSESSRSISTSMYYRKKIIKEPL